MFKFFLPLQLSFSQNNGEQNKRIQRLNSSEFFFCYVHVHDKVHNTTQVFGEDLESVWRHHLRRYFIYEVPTDILYSTADQNVVKLAGAGVARNMETMLDLLDAVRWKNVSYCLQEAK